MKYRKIGSTDLEVSEVGFGLWTLSTSGWPKVNEQYASKLLQASHSMGVTFFDTADVYGEGYGEEILAKALREQRHHILVATKVGYDFYNKLAFLSDKAKPKPEGIAQNFAPKHIRFACEQSLRRLLTDYIDLYQLHEPPLAVLQDDEVLETLKSLQKEGKIRYFGAVLDNSDAEIEELAATMRERRPTSVQLAYNLFDRTLAQEIIPVARENRIGVIARDPHAGGILDGTLTTAAIETLSPPLKKAALENLRKARALEQFAVDRGLTLGQLAAKFCLKERAVSSVLPNILSVAHLKEFVETSDRAELTESEWSLVEEVCEKGSSNEEASKRR